MLRSYLLSPSYHFLGSLAKLYFAHFSTQGLNPHRVAFVFPHRRSCLYFYQSLIKEKKQESFFLPRVFSLDEFINFCGTKVITRPYRLITTSGLELILLRTLRDLQLNFEAPQEDIYWARHYLQVFEEFEKEGLTPKDLKWPPEGLPNEAQTFLENLAKVYDRFKAHCQNLGYITQAELLTNLTGCLKSDGAFNSLGLSALYFCGFAGLRRIEGELLRVFVEAAKRGELQVTFVFAWNNSREEIHPVLRRTIEVLDLYPQSFPDELTRERGLELGSKLIQVFEAADLHEEVDFVVEKLKAQLCHLDKNRIHEEIAIVVPKSETLIPLVHALRNFRNLKLNTAQSFPLNHLPINSLLLQIINLQLERKNLEYPASGYLDLLSHPLLDASSLMSCKIRKELEPHLEKRLHDYLTLEEIENKVPSYKEELSKLHQVLFRNWMKKDDPASLSRALKELLDFVLLAYQSDPEVAEELSAYINFLEDEVFPLLEHDKLWKGLTENAYPLLILKKLLESASHYLKGEPLCGLQVLGFMETRLLNFPKVFLLDLNEGVLPPKEEFNPLLTDEMRLYFGLPVFSSALWDYYFLIFLESAKELFLTYLGSSDEDSAQEPSRFLYRLRFELAKANVDLSCDSTSYCPTKRTFFEGIPTKDDHREIILSYLRSPVGVSRSFFETYLRCPAKFYFKYLLKLNEQEGFPAIVGKVLHKVFENLFKGSKSLSSREYVNFSALKEKAPKVFENIWETEGKGKLDPLSDLLLRTLAKGFLERYFKQLEDKKIKRRVIGLEEELKTLFSTKALGETLDITLYGRCDLKMEEESEQGTSLLILDLKTGVGKDLKPRSFKSIFLNFTSSSISSDLTGLEGLRSPFGADLENFQVLFYLLLEGKNIKKSSYSFVRPGLIRLAIRDEIETYLYTDSSKGQKLGIRVSEISNIEIKLSGILEALIKHMFEAPFFYFVKKCDWCSFEPVCLSYRMGLG